MTRQPGQRPTDAHPPVHLPPSPPVPEPAAPAPEPDEALSPTRYGDWEKNGIAVDF